MHAGSTNIVTVIPPQQEMSKYITQNNIFLFIHLFVFRKYTIMLVILVNKINEVNNKYTIHAHKDNKIYLW